MSSGLWDNDEWDAVSNWLEQHPQDSLEHKPTSGNYRWPYLWIECRHSRLFATFHRIHEEKKDGKVATIKSKGAVTPSRVISEARLKPEGQDKSSLLKLANLIDDCPYNHADPEYRVVPESMVYAVLSTAADYRCSVLITSTGFNYIGQIDPVPLTLEWKLEESSASISIPQLGSGTTFLDSIPPTHLHDDGNFTKLLPAEGLTLPHVKMLTSMPEIPVEDAMSVYRRIIQHVPSSPIAPPIVGDKLVDIDASRLTFVLRFPKSTPMVAELLFRYYRGVELSGHGPPTSIIEKNGKTWRIARDGRLERQAILLLESFGLTKSASSDRLFFGPPAVNSRPGGASNEPVTDPAFWADFFESIAPKLVAYGWRIFPSKQGPEVIDGQSLEGAFADAQEPGSFSIRVGLDVDGEHIAILPLVLNLLERYDPSSIAKAFDHAGDFSHLAVDDKRLIRMPTERLKSIVQMVQNSIDVMTTNEDAIELPMNRATEISLMEGQSDNPISWSGQGKVRSLIEVFNRFAKPPKVDTPSTIVATLEPYQQECVAHAAFLAEHGLPLLLCDDMGLGKTLQVLSIYALAKQSDSAVGPALVLAPTTALMQWEAEAAKHCPSLRVVHTGSDGLDERLGVYEQCLSGDIDILVSTYQKICNDVAEVRRIPWHMVVADEAQSIKGVKAKMRKDIKSLPVPFTYPVTGTPIENSLMDLWALMDVACPGYLGSEKWFKQNLADPIELEQSGDALRRLRTMVAPLLRRKRYCDEDVALEVPTPDVQIIEVPIEGAQRDLYESVRVTQEKRVRELLEAKGLKRSTGQVLHAILGMRQIVCDPRIYTMQRHSVTATAKLNRLTSLIRDLKEQGKPTLVFSNFKAMIPLFQQAVEDLRLRFSTVTGSVPQATRQKEIKRFRDGKSDVFLATLGSMNSSVDLFEAKALVLYEPWWNPQKEKQGMGRMVRRGQQDDTTVYRFVTPNSVEMQLMAIQDRKLSLVDAVFNGDMMALSQRLTEEDIAKLFV